jgi:hypothetical protein
MFWREIGEFVGGFSKTFFPSLIKRLLGRDNSPLIARGGWKPADAKIMFIDDEKVPYINGLKNNTFAI